MFVSTASMYVIPDATVQSIYTKANVSGSTMQVEVRRCIGAVSSVA